MSAESRLVVPDAFTNSLKKYGKRQRELIAKRKNEQKVQTETERRQEEVAMKKAIKDLPHAQAVFDWAHQFRTSPEGKRALEIAHHSCRGEASLRFFEHGRSFSLYVCERSIRWYRWGPGSKEKYCHTPQELAQAAQYDGYCLGLLKAACEAIKCGEIWKYIQEDLELLTSRD